jgi:hypothetical protein
MTDMSSFMVQKTLIHHQRQDAAQATSLYEQMLKVGPQAGLGRLIRRGAGKLLDLNQMKAQWQVREAHHAGTQPVDIGAIKGSEGRSSDFDAAFHPRRANNKQRWVSVAMARLNDVALPPVELIRVCDMYFVRDGHHRISVARALGEQVIDAEVTIWDVA